MGHLIPALMANYVKCHELIDRSVAEFYCVLHLEQGQLAARAVAAS
jgi:hypothetical protein